MAARYWNGGPGADIRVGEGLRESDLNGSSLAMMGFVCMAHHIIRRIRWTHCKRGPSICERCRETNVDGVCLLDVSPPRQGEVQRRVIRVHIDGEWTWREFDIVRVFDSAEAAIGYADKHGIADMDLN